MSHSSAATTTTPPEASAPTLDDISQLEAVMQSAVPCDNTLIDNFTDQISAKVRDALADGKFSMRETAGLTLAVCSGVQAIFPSIRGSNKKQIAISVLHTVVRGLILLNLLGPEFNVALDVIPGVIDSVIYVAGGLEALWEKLIPEFFAWLRRVVWGDDNSVIEQQHIAAVVATLDVTSASGLKQE